MSGFLAYDIHHGIIMTAMMGPLKFENFSRPGKARATRRAKKVASVPLEVNRSFSAHGTVWTIISARDCLSTCSRMGMDTYAPPISHRLSS